MITTKIQNLITELKEECAKEHVALVCAATDKDKVHSALGGNSETLVILTSAMTKKMEKKIGIPWPILEMFAIRAAKNEKQEPDHTFVIDNEQDLADVLDRIMRGEFQ